MGSTASVVYNPEDEPQHVTAFFSQLIRVLEEDTLTDETKEQLCYLSKDAEQFQARQVRDILQMSIDGTEEGEWTKAATGLTKLDSNLEVLRKQLVPAKMKDGVFWNKYFNCVFQLTANKAFSLSLVSDGLYQREKVIATNAVLKACRVCQRVFQEMVDEDTITKKDKSPVTVADYAAQAIIINEIRKVFTLDPVVGEEDSSELAKNDELRAKVTALCNSVYEGGDQLTEERVMRMIDYGQYQGGRKGRHWTVDPIDGTKGFLRGEQYAVCLALIDDGEVVVGVMGCPNLARKVEETEEARNGCVFTAVKGSGVVSTGLEGEDMRIRTVSSLENLADFNFVESVEAEHSNHSDSAIIAQRLGVQAAAVRMDSQCKYAAVARGDACIYLRLPTRKHYEERIWDHAGGYLIVKEAGGMVTDTRGKDLDFSVGRTLRNNLGVVASNGKQHHEIVKVVSEVLHPETNYFLRVLGKDQPSAEDVARVLHEQLGLDRRCVQVLVQVEDDDDA